MKEKEVPWAHVVRWLTGLAVHIPLEVHRCVGATVHAAAGAE